MAKGKRVAVGLDDEPDAIINHSCVDGNCDDATVILSAKKTGFTINHR